MAQSSPSSAISPAASTPAIAPLVVLTLAGAVAAFVWRLWGTGPAINGGGEAYSLAQSLALHGTFADPFAGLGKTGPSAHLPPLFPGLLALIMWVSPTLFAPITFFLALLAHGLNAALLPLLSIRLLGTPRPGWIAAIASILLPVYQLYPTWDAIYSADLLMLGVLIFAGFIERRSFGWRSAAAAGCYLSVLLLMNAICGIALVVITVALLLRKKIPAREAAPFLSLALAVSLLGMTPWIVRNYQIFGRFVPLRDDLGIALYSSNNDCAQATLEANLQTGCHQARHPIGSRPENQLVAQLGEVEYNRDRLGKALAWVNSHRSRFLSLTIQRARAFWYPQRQPAVWLMTTCGIIGLALLLRRDPWMSIVFTTALLLYSLLYYFVEAQERYLYPVYWCVCLCAGYFGATLTRIFARWQIA